MYCPALFPLHPSVIPAPLLSPPRLFIIASSIVTVSPCHRVPPQKRLLIRHTNSGLVDPLRAVLESIVAIVPCQLRRKQWHVRAAM